ncbi:NAD(+) diphosphatase [Moraxella nasovis]|uniref:NAD(+) diphosphatase n=1 Tax=Moraxella nasovis TaxID=2904121 RepID=UPI001F6013E7|nr:NAD(+) diphosphatase [Moraxella nasovis]UNU73324.1 NAD(+) diphosphatase [Moraxella nasovis]
MTHQAALIIKNDSVLCHNGVPVLFNISTNQLADLGAISLAFGEILPKTASYGVISHVIDLDRALACGLVGAFGSGYTTTTHPCLELISFRQLAYHCDSQTAEQLSRAIQLVLWQNDHRFCSRCGTPTKMHHSENAMICPACRHHAYPRVQPCIIVAIIRNHPTNHKPQILLAKHHRHADKGVYGLIAGFVEAGESLESALCRETLEEVNVTIREPRYISSQPWPYPTNLMLGFIAHYDGGVITPQTDEISHAQFFDFHDLPAIPEVGTIARALICQAAKECGIALT